MHFECLFAMGKAYAFPCDSKGHVDLDALSDNARNNYFYARALIGRELCPPEVRRLYEDELR